MGAMPTPHAIIFDLDGTLTDTEVTWAEVRRDLTSALGRTYPEHASVAMMGMSTPEWAKYCADNLGYPGTLQEIGDRVISGVADAYAAGRVRLLPGAGDAVRRMAARGPIAVASSSPPLLIDAGLNALGVSALVEVRVSSETVGFGKPRPEVYLEACRRLGVAPADAVAIEDSTNGILSAAAAGMRVVAIPLEPHVPTAEALALCGAVLGSLDELTDEVVEALYRA